MADTFARMRQIIGTTAEWAANDLVIGNGEVAAERLSTGVVKLKMGDGVKTFSQLPYVEGQFNLGELDARYVQISETTAVGGISYANKWPRLDGSGFLPAALFNLTNWDARYVNEVDTSAVGGFPSANKVSRLDANGLLSISMIPTSDIGPTLDSRFVNESDTYATLNVAGGNKWPKLGADGMIDNSLLHIDQLDDHFVPIADTFQIGGAAAANLWPRMSADGKLDGSLLRTSLLSYKGQIHSETQPAPVAPLNGDFYMQAIDATVGASWGAAAGLPIGKGDFLSWSITGGWQIYDSQIDPEAYVKRDGDVMLGKLVTVDSKAASAGFRLLPGVAPTTPLDGDMWATSTAFWGRAAGVSYPFLLAGGRGLFADGTAALPSISFVNDPDTGLYSPAAGRIGFATDGVERMRITPAGNVGIGTNAPNAPLNVAGPSGQVLCISTPGVGPVACYQSFQDGTGRKGYFGFGDSIDTLMLMNERNQDLVFGTNSVFRMTIKSDGNVGIGTANPAYRLDVNFRAIFGPPAATPGVAGYVVFRDDTATPRWLAGILGSIGNQNFSIRDLAADRNAIQITNAGHVGISIDNPQQPLEVSTAIGIRASSPLLAFYNATGAARLGYLNHDGLSLVFATEVAGGALKFNTSGIERVRIAADGRVGVPIAVPRARLHVLADGPSTQWQDTSKTLILGEESGNTQYGMQLGMFINPGGAWVGGIQQIAAGGVSTLVLNPGGGNVGVGNDQPGYQVDVKSTAPAVRTYNTTNNCSMLIESAVNGGNVGTTSGSNLYFITGGGQRLILTSDGGIFCPNSDGTMLLGAAGNRWGSIYATKGFFIGGAECVRICDANPYYAWYNAAQTTRFGYFIHDGTGMLLQNEAAGGPISFESPISHNFRVNGNGIVSITIEGMWPQTDGAKTLGRSGFKWSSVWATNGTIQTSDARKKEWRGGFTDAELKAAKQIAAEIGVYQWIDELAKDGGDNRFRVGARAQEVAAILENNGLDWRNYSFVQYDEWEAEEGTPGFAGVPEVSAQEAVEADENGEGGSAPVPFTPAIPPSPGTPGREAGNLWSADYAQIALFIAAAQEQRLAALEALLP